MSNQHSELLSLAQKVKQDVGSHRAYAPEIEDVCDQVAGLIEQLQAGQSSVSITEEDAMTNAPNASAAWKLVEAIRKGLDISDLDSFTARTEALNDLMILFALVQRLEEQFGQSESAVALYQERLGEAKERIVSLEEQLEAALEQRDAFTYKSVDIERLQEQLEAAQERLSAYETPGYINPVQKVIELQEQQETLRGIVNELGAYFDFDSLLPDLQDRISNAVEGTTPSLREQLEWAQDALREILALRENQGQIGLPTAWEIAERGLGSNPAWKYGDPIKATMTVSNPASRPEYLCDCGPNEYCSSDQCHGAVPAPANEPDYLNHDHPGDVADRETWANDDSDPARGEPS